MKNAFIQELYDLDLYHPTRYRLKKNEILTFKQGIAAMWAMGLPQQVFVSKYLINLPSEKELKKIIEEEKEKRQ